MSAAQSITRSAPRLRTKLGMGLVALGVLVAVAVTIVIVGLTGGSRTGGATPSVDRPPLIPRHGAGQADATRDLGIAQAHGGGTSPAPVAGRPAPLTRLNCVFIRAEHRCVVP